MIYYQSYESEQIMFEITCETPASARYFVSGSGGGALTGGECGEI